MKISLDKLFNKYEQTHKSPKATPHTIETKSPQANSLEAMSNYGRAQLNMSFKGENKQFDKAAIEQTLINAKDSLNKPRFTQDETNQLLSSLTCDNIDILAQLLDMKNLDNEPRFNFNEIFCLMSGINSDNYDVFKILSNECTDEKRYQFAGFDIHEKRKHRFNGYEIHQILRSTTNDKKDILYLMLEQKYKSGDYAYYFARHITEVLDATNENNKDLVKSAILAKNNEGEPRIRCIFLADMIKESESKDITDIFKTLIEAKDDEGKNRFDDYLRIAFILSRVTDENKDLFNTMLNAKSKGKYRFDDYDIEIILRHAQYNKIPNDVVYNLINLKNQNGRFRFNNETIQNILEEMTPENADIFNKLISAKNDDGSFKFNGKAIYAILESANLK